MKSFDQIALVLRQWPGGKIPEGSLGDLVCDRLRLALIALRARPGSVGKRDLASLIRQVLRQESAVPGRNGHAERLTVPRGDPWPDREQWRQFGCTAEEGADGRFLVGAKEWSPAWLERRSEKWPPFAAVERREKRRHQEPVPADPAIHERFGCDTFLSIGQADATRAVALSPPGSVSLVCLPTGAGKSQVGLVAGLIGDGSGLTLVVMPTVALAYDQVQEAKKRCPGLQIDAWQSGLTPQERNAIRQRIRSGSQHLLYAGPESVIHALSNSLSAAASSGLIRAFVVDEAHLVAQWGHGFRPEFQSMCGLWNYMRTVCPEGKRFKTVLMTATLTTESLETLGTFFGPPEEINVFASVQLRPEPDYFMALCRDRHEQQERVLETLCHGPRPAILYATEKKHADDWWRLLRESGWLRVARIHGDTPPNDRNRAIEAWRGNELDIMVATSAFGLGMDKGDVRLVLHACVPETVDRFYQEVGRGGRDGNASASVLLWTQEDIRTAKSLTFPRVITEDLGLKRWKNIWYASKWSDSILLAYLRALHEELDWDTDRNMSWNLKTILLLARAGAVEVHYRPPPDQDLEDGEDPEAADSEREKEPERYYSEIPLRLNRSDTLEEAFWQEAVAKSRDATMEAANTGWRRMEDILENRRSLVDVLREVYQIRSSHVWIDPDSNEPICPPETLCNSIGDPLQRLIADLGSEVVLVTYTLSQYGGKELEGAMREVLETLIALGIREVGVPASWFDKRASQKVWLDKSHRFSKERYVILKDALQIEASMQAPWLLPRLTILEPPGPNSLALAKLIEAQRPVHLLLLPEGLPDPCHPDRRLGDVTPPGSLSLANLRNRLQL